MVITLYIKINLKCKILVLRRKRIKILFELYYLYLFENQLNVK